MRLLYALFLLAMVEICAMAQGPSKIAVMANTNGNLLTPTNFFISNLVAGANVGLVSGAGGKVTISAVATNVVSTNLDSIIVTNFVRGTNQDFYTTTNVPGGIMTWDWFTNLLSPVFTENYLVHGDTNDPRFSSALTLTIGTNMVMWTNGSRLYIAGQPGGGGAGGTNYYLLAPDASRTGLANSMNLGAGAGIELLTNGTQLLVSNTLSTTIITNGRVLYVSPYADGDGIVGRIDKPYAFSNALAAATKGDTILVNRGKYTNTHSHIWSAGGDYSGTHNLYPIDNLVIRGEGWPELYYPTGATVFNLRAAANVLMDGLVIRSVKNDANYVAVSNALQASDLFGAISLIHCTNITIRNCEFIDLWGWGVYAVNSAGGAAWPSTNGIRIDGCRFDNCGASTALFPEAGGAILADSDWVLTDNRVVNCQNGISYRAADATSTGRMIVLNNTIKDANYYGVKAESASFSSADIRFNTISRHTNTVNIGGGAEVFTNTLPYMVPAAYPMLVQTPCINNIQIKFNTLIGAYRGFTYNTTLGKAYLSSTNLVFSFNHCEGQRNASVCFDEYTDVITPANNWSVTNYATYIVGNDFIDMGQYAVLWSGVGFYSFVVGNNALHFDKMGKNQFAFGWKLASYGYGLVFDGNFADGQRMLVVSEPAAHAYHLGTNQHAVRLGYNPAVGVAEIIHPDSVLTDCIRTDFRFNIPTNGSPDNLTMYIGSNATNNQEFITHLVSSNYLRGVSNGLAAQIAGGSGSVSNAVAAVWLNGTNLVASGATNLNLIQGANVTIIGTNSPAGQANVYISGSAVTGGDQYSGGSMVLSNLTGTGALTNASAYQASSMVLSNLVGTAGTTVTNRPSVQASSMVLSNIVGTGALTNPAAYQASSMVLSNIVGSGALTNPSAYQASSMVLSNLVGTAETTVTNRPSVQASSMVLSNIAGMASQYWTNAQASSMVLSNIVGSGALTNPSAYQASSMVLSNLIGTVAGNATNIVGSGGITVTSNAGVYTIGGGSASTNFNVASFNFITVSNVATIATQNVDSSRDQQLSSVC